MGYLLHKENVIWISYSSPPGAPAALRALRRLRTRVATALFAPSFATAMRHSSVSATNRPPRRGWARPNCHSHWLISYTLVCDVASLPVRPVGCMCQPMWKPGAPVLAELVWDGRSIVAYEGQGHQGHARQHIGGEAHIQNGRG